MKKYITLRKIFILVSILLVILIFTRHVDYLPSNDYILPTKHHVYLHSFILEDGRTCLAYRYPDDSVKTTCDER